MDCYKVLVKDAPAIEGFSARGMKRKILPGEYTVHYFAKQTAPFFRFVGADQPSGDIYLPESAHPELSLWPRLPAGAPLMVIGKA